MPVTLEQVRRVYESNQQYRTRAAWEESRDTIQAEQVRRSFRRSKAERAAFRAAKRAALENPVTQREKIAASRIKKRESMPGRRVARISRCSRRNHKSLSQQAA